MIKTIGRVGARGSVFVLMTAFCTTSAYAIGTPTYTVYFDGGGKNAGEIVANNADPLPDGACGVRVGENDVLEWYWAEYNPYGLVDPMPGPPDGPPNSTTNPPGNSPAALVEFTGPFGDGCGDEYVFHNPTTGIYPELADGTPAGSGALVFQVLPGSVEWLTKGFTLWESDDDDIGEDPGFVSICELFPDVCIDPGFVTEDPCLSNVINCSDVTSTGNLSVKASDTVQAAIGMIRRAGRSRQSGVVQKALTEATFALRHAGRLRERMQGRLDIVARDMATRSENEETLRDANAVMIAGSLAERNLASCRRVLGDLGSSGGRLAMRSIERTLLVCSSAKSSFDDVHQAVSRAGAWTLIRERN